MFTGASLRFVALLGLAATTLSAADAALTVDKNLPEYVAVDGGVSGSIVSIGSDTMNNMMALWGEGFSKIYPNVTIEIEGKGSSTAIPALVEGRSVVGPMSRKAKSKEIDAFKEKFGYAPVQLPTSIDMLAVYVNKDNPIKGLSLPQVDAMFSSTRKGGEAADITSWGQVGLTGAWGQGTVGLYGRNSASGTYGYFKKHALFKGDYKNSVKEQPGSSAVVQGVATDRFGVGYSGIGYKTADVRAIALSRKAGGELITAEPANAYSGKYPLSRFLLLTVNLKPGTSLDPLRREFVKYIFSQQGQQDVIKDGYLPVSAVVATKALASVGIK